MSVTIRRLEPQDLDFTYERLLAEKWNDRREDAERMLNYDPEGCFIAEVNNKPAGHIFSIRYGKLAWIGYLIVTPEQRQKGIATGLMKTTLHYLNDKNVQTIKLEAIPEISELYRRFGFKKEYDSLRFTGNPQHKKLTEDNSIQPLRPRQITETARFDAEYFGENRMKVLFKLCSEYPDKCFIALNEKTIEGYIMCRRAVSGYKIGPWVCSPQTP